MCLKKLEELGVYGSISVVDEYSMDLLPLDSDVMSMEADGAFKVGIKKVTIVDLLPLDSDVMSMEAD